MIKILKILLTIFFVTITSTLLFSQDRCGTMNRLNYEITIDDQLNDKRQRIETVSYTHLTLPTTPVV